MAPVNRPPNGGDALVAALKAHQVDAVFGIPGAHTLSIYDALLDEPGIRSIVARNEAGAGYMADGYARASGKPGVALTITGPGATNAITAVAGAYADSSPMLVVSSQLPTGVLGAGLGFLHEMRDQQAAFAAATDWTARANAVSHIAPALDAAMSHFADGRPTPAYLEIPLDILDDPETAPPRPLNLPSRRVRPHVRDAALRQAATLLLSARRPVIYAGWGVISAEASADLIALAEALGAPVATSVKGKGAIPDDHPLCLGCAWAAEVRASPALTEADMMLAIGTRFTLRTASWGRVPIPPTLIHVDIDESSHGLTVPATLALTGDAGDVLRGLLELIIAENRPRSEDTMVWGGYRADVRASIASQVRQRSPFVADTLDALRRGLDRDALITNDNCLFCFWAGRYMPIYEPRTWHFPMQFCTLGWALPAAIGAKIVCPDRQVVALAGDGGFMFTCQELVTAASLGLNLPIIVFNDGAYGSVRENQTKRYGARYSGISLATPDFPRLAEACNARGVRLSQPDELPGALAGAFAADRPTLIEMPVTLEFP
jgi:thiamine pyrophosphate-dependent acetolactate synthase large subunit-like protein